MGSGKGSIDHYATPVKAGRVIIEVGGHCEFFEVSSSNMSFSTFISFNNFKNNLYFVMVYINYFYSNFQNFCMLLNSF